MPCRKLILEEFNFLSEEDKNKSFSSENKCNQVCDCNPCPEGFQRFAPGNPYFDRLLNGELLDGESRVTEDDANCNCYWDGTVESCRTIGNNCNEQTFPCKNPPTDSFTPWCPPGVGPEYPFAGPDCCECIGPPWTQADLEVGRVCSDDPSYPCTWQNPADCELYPFCPHCASE